MALYHECFLTGWLPFAHVWSVVGDRLQVMSLYMYEEALSFRSGLLETAVSIPFTRNVTSH